jgi:hypothetical protein
MKILGGSETMANQFPWVVQMVVHTNDNNAFVSNDCLVTI